jgi:cytochrome P450
MEEMIQDEIILLCNSLDKQVGLPLAMDRIFNISVINALWTLISGSRFELDDPKLKKLIEYMDFLVKESGNTSILTVFPWIRHIAPKMSGWTGTKTCALALNHFIDEVIDEHVVNFASNKESVREDPKDFIDAFLAQIESSDPGSSFHGELGIKNLKATLLDLMLAGSETTATTLTWAILFMIKYPDIQRKVREEIVNEVGCSRPIRLDDKSRLPYTEAVIQEVLRMACVGPLGIPHYAQADIHIGQHVIPQGTTILPNIYRITRNPKVFTQPNIFNPKRFLDTQGKCIKNDHNAVFSVGE